MCYQENTCNCMLQPTQYEDNEDCGEICTSTVFCPTRTGEGSRGEKVVMDYGQGIKICQSLNLNMDAQLEEPLMHQGLVMLRILKPKRW